jgi:hypothetical protein
MAKNGNGSGRKNGKNPLVSALYESGKMNGPVGGPKGGPSPKDPFGYLRTPDKAPSGSPADRGASKHAERESAH